LPPQSAAVHLTLQRDAAIFFWARPIAASFS
jgi:hypothetical protein